MRGLAAFADRPHDERLPAANVASDDTAKAMRLRQHLGAILATLQDLASFPGVTR